MMPVIIHLVMTWRSFERSLHALKNVEATLSRYGRLYKSSAGDNASSPRLQYEI
jgi:hypothetical protein